MLDYDTLGRELEERTTPWSDSDSARAWTADPQDDWPQPPEASSARLERYPVPPIRRPLILVGGFAANALYRAEHEPGGSYQGQQVWPPFHFEPDSGDWRLHGVAEVNQAGLLPGGLVIGQYDPLLLFLEQEQGYTPGKNFFVFPYRWTDSSRLSGQRLAGFIQRVIDSYPFDGAEEPGCDVICHSMGGLVTRAAGLLFGAPLVRVVYLACPFFGAGKGYFNLHPAHSVQVVDNMLLNRILERFAPEGNPLFGSTTDLTECFQKMDSLYEMLPDQIGFERGLCPVGLRRSMRRLPTPLDSWQETYLKEPSTAFPEPLHPQVLSAMDFKARLSTHMPGKAYLVLYSAAYPTVGRVDLAFEFSRFALFGSAYDAGQGGDGSVPAASGKGPGPALQVHGRHLAVPNHRTTFYWISRFLHSL